jgi:hypothetical protein
MFPRVRYKIGTFGKVLHHFNIRALTDYSMCINLYQQQLAWLFDSLNCLAELRMCCRRAQRRWHLHVIVELCVRCHQDLRRR